MTASPAFITLENISKRFPGVLALDQINLTLNKGEVHCLAGQNGCGKSTIIKIISGVYQPEKGANISLEGKLFHALTPQLSGYYGIQVIYQDLSLFPNLTVAENIAIHRYLPGGHFWVRKRVMRQTALDAMARVGVHIDPDKKVEKLSIADRQLVAICRAIAAEARLVIMDEPTASLTRQEVDGLLRVVNELKAAGICVVFVSHRLDEVMEVADRISVMRDGKLVGTWPASELDSHELAFLMTGQRFHYSPLPPLPPAEQAPLLEVRNLSRGEKYRNVNLALRGGEIVSIVGLLGAGRTELCLSLFGAAGQRRDPHRGPGGAAAQQPRSGAPRHRLCVGGSPDAGVDHGAIDLRQHHRHRLRSAAYLARAVGSRQGDRAGQPADPRSEHQGVRQRIAGENPVRRQRPAHRHRQMGGDPAEDPDPRLAHRRRGHRQQRRGSTRSPAIWRSWAWRC
ncbi:Arabinose import ATP-binding protein AraG [Serratia marcescens]|uniref:Arabinose import ATP-binding protein AraG n=1 Tax=Serratia marcescens TaxID=615 RepID=A0A379YBC3_SERMA|nr:Arabinose import ATP-binding protein AraG [Serratia marcescens]